MPFDFQHPGNAADGAEDMITPALCCVAQYMTSTSKAALQDSIERLQSARAAVNNGLSEHGLQCIKLLSNKICLALAEHPLFMDAERRYLSLEFESQANTFFESVASCRPRKKDVVTLLDAVGVKDLSNLAVAMNMRPQPYISNLILTAIGKMARVWTPNECQFISYLCDHRFLFETRRDAAICMSLSVGAMITQQELAAISNEFQPVRQETEGVTENATSGNDLL